MRVEGDVDEVVDTGEEADLREPAHAGQQSEVQVRVGHLDVGVEAAQEVPICPGQLGAVESVEDRLVVLVDEQHHAPAGTPVHLRDQASQPCRQRTRPGAHSRAFLGGLELGVHVGAQPVGIAEHPAAEVEAQHRMAHRPVPAATYGEAVEQLLATLEQLLDGVEKQALAESPRPRQEVVRAPVDQPGDVGRLVDVVAAVLADLAKGLYADRQAAPGRPRTLPALEAPLRVTVAHPPHGAPPPVLSRLGDLRMPQRLGGVTLHTEALNRRVWVPV